MSTRKINALLKKTEHYDADERYMATNDLIKELNDLKKLDPCLQVPIRKAILKQLEDKGADVSTIAVKALETLVAKFNADQIVVIVDSMGAMLVDPAKASSRDIYSEGLVAVLGACDEETGKKISPNLVKNLKKGLNPRTSDDEATSELACMVVLVALMDSFGGECKDLNSILSSLLTLLGHPYECARLQACQTLGPLTPYLNATDFSQLMQRMIKEIQESQNPGVFIQSVVVISKFAALRVAGYLDVLVPILLGVCKKETEDLDQTTILWSNCLEAFNSLIQRCPNKISDYLDKIIKISEDKLVYDPNFVESTDAKMDEDDDEEGEGDEEDWGFGDEDDEDFGEEAEADGDWGGDDIPDASADESWKVRKSAIRVLETFIISRSDVLKQYADKLSEILIKRFTERDASVQEQIFHTYRDLIKEATSANEKKFTGRRWSLSAPAPPVLVRQRSFYQSLVDAIPTTLNKIDAVFPKVNIPTKKAIFSLLTEIIRFKQGGLEDFFKTIVPHIIEGLTAKGKAAELNEDALILAHQLIINHTFEDLEEYIVEIASAAKTVVGAENILVKPKALMLCGDIARCLQGQASEKKELETVVIELYKITFTQLEEKATNETIKIASIDAMSMILASQADILRRDCKKSLLIIKARLSNSVTQISALKGITRIAKSKHKVDLSLFVIESISVLSGFLRQVSSPLKHQTMFCLDALVQTHGKKIVAKDYTTILKEVGPHIGDADLQLAGQGLTLMSSILKVSPPTASQIAKEILPKIMMFVKCPLLHGFALRSLIKFFQDCVQHGSKEKQMTYNKLLSALLGCINDKLQRPGYSAVAQCIAGIAERTTDKLKIQTVKQFKIDFCSKDTPPPTKKIALLSIGEIGHSIDLSSYDGLFKDILTTFNHMESDVREAASFALGNVTVGNMGTFLPQLLQMVSTDSEHEYLLLCSLKENIISHQNKVQVFLEYVDRVMPLLCQRAEAKDEGVRQITAECLGRLGVIDINKVIKILKKLMVSKVAQVRAVAITALRYSLQGQYVSEGIGYEIGMGLDAFLTMLSDDDIDVRREAVLTARSFCISRDITITRQHLKKTILPALYSETKAHPDLIHEVDYGNFKMIIDDGLQLRKAVFQCLDTILESHSRHVDMRQFNNAMKVGLADADYDVQIMTYKSYEKLASTYPLVLLEMLDDFPKLIMASVKGHLKVAKSREPRRAVECLTVIVSVMLKFNTIKGVETCNKYQSFFQQVCRTKLLQDILKELQK